MFGKAIQTDNIAARWNRLLRWAAQNESIVDGDEAQASGDREACQEFEIENDQPICRAIRPVEKIVTDQFVHSEYRRLARNRVRVKPNLKRISTDDFGFEPLIAGSIGCWVRIRNARFLEHANGWRLVGGNAQQIEDVLLVRGRQREFVEF